MSNQANNGIQPNSTIGKPLEHLPTEANTDEQVAQELNAEQLEGAAGGGPGGWVLKKMVSRTVGVAAKVVTTGSRKGLIRH